MKIALFALLVGVCAAMQVTPQYFQNIQGIQGIHGVQGIQGRVADKVFLQKQRDLLRLLRHVHQPNSYLDQVEIAKTFDIESSISLFDRPVVVEEFIQLYRYGLLPRKEIFSIMNDVHRRQVIAVFHLMHYAKTYDTFYRVACWCREHVNEGMFVYALTVAVLHRPDCRGLILPPAYEIYPYYFINHETIKKAQELKMQDFAILKPEVYQHLLQDPKMMMGKLPIAHDYEYSKMSPVYGNMRTDDMLVQGQRPYSSILNRKPWMMADGVQRPWMMADDVQRPWMMADDVQRPWMMADTVQRPYVTKDVPVMNKYQKSVYGQIPSYLSKNFYGKTPMYGKTLDKTSYLPKYMTHEDVSVRNPLLYKNMLNTMQQNMQPEVYTTVEDGIQTIIIPTNYSGWYLNLDEEQHKLSYFMEDIGLNAYYYYFHMDYPFWMVGGESGLNKDRRGELYLYNIHQLITRYYLERLSNGLGEIGMIDITDPVPHVCTLVYENGLPFPMRPAKTDLVYDDYTKNVYERMNILEKRIIEVIDLGYAIDVNGNKVPIYTPEGINILGNLIQGNADSVNRRYYGNLLKLVKILLGYSGKPLDNYRLQPSTLELFETAMRDPMFYRMYKRIVHYFLYYKKNLPAYKYTDLLYQGVKINSIDVDQFITYFDYFNVELNNALYNDYTVTTDVPKVLVKARQMRLNHKPFTYRINVSSDKTTKAVVRVFLGPKYNELGQLISFEQNRVNFVELDKFTYDLKTGENMIVRNSRNMHHIVKDRTSYYTLYRKVMGALEGTEEFILDNSEAHCGFPDRLLLPKGTVDGMQFQLFVMVTPYQGTTTGVDSMVMDNELMYTCGIGSGMRFIDNLPLGYPLDRDIDVTQFFVPNMHVQDVVIRHIDETIMDYPTMMLRN